MIFQVFAFTSTSLFGSSLLIGLQAFLRMWLSQQGPQGPVSIPTGLCKPTLLYLTHQGSLHIAPFRGKCLTWLAVGLIFFFFFGHGRQEIILAWKHYFRWLKMLQYFYFPSSRWSSCLSSADELMPYFLQGWQRFPKSQKICPCCYCYILLRKMFLKLFHQKYISLDTKNMGWPELLRRVCNSPLAVRSEANLAAFSPWDVTQYHRWCMQQPGRISRGVGWVEEDQWLHAVSFHLYSILSLFSFTFLAAPCDL